MLFLSTAYKGMRLLGIVSRDVHFATTGVHTPVVI
jgi:hypothetical protein